MGNRVAIGLLALCVLLSTRASALDSKSAVVVASVESILAIDMLQTMDIARMNKTYSVHEMNPVLGRHPSNTAIVGYFAAVGVGYAVAYRALPPKWGNLLSVGIIGIETITVIKNHSCGYRIKF